MQQPYDHKQIEPKWQKIWAKNNAGETKGPSKTAKTGKTSKKFYSLIEFPYPSGEGLHVGHIRSNTAMDIISHKRRREGYDVLYPIGWDAFGLPTENYAIKTGIQPAVVTKKNTDTFRRQLKSLGFFFDWSREINTTDPKYYKWTQWIFLQFLKEGLAYKKKMTINWCPKDLIGLANEEVIDGKCERCGTPVEKREKEQWMLAITKYADKLLEGLDATECDMPKFIDKVNPPQPDKPYVKRNVVHAIVFDPKTKKYLIIRNKKHGWDTVVMGGVEAGESIVEAARREVREETGYTDIEFKRILGGPTEAQYYAKHKGENRIAIARAVCFELKSDARVAITDDNGEGNEILWVSESDFVPGKMVNSELPVWLARMSVNVERDEKDPNVLRFVDISTLSGFRPDMPTVERNPVAVIVKHWKEDKYIGLKWKKVAWKTIITGGPEGDQTPEEGAITEIMEETGYQHPKFVRRLGRVDAKFFHNPKNINRLAHFDVMYFELKDGERRELTAEEQANHEVVWLSKEEMSEFISPASQKYVWDTMFLGGPNWFDEPKPVLDWPESIKESQRNWIGKSEGAEFDFNLSLGTGKKKYKYVLLHGYKGLPADPIYPWLKAELEKKGHTVLIPALPNPEKPSEDEQVAAAMAAMEKIGYDENTILYGHSLGTVVAMKVAEKLKKKIAGLVLAGGFIDPEFKDHPRGFAERFNWHFDVQKIRDNAGFIKALHDVNDVAVSEGQADRLGAMLGITIQKFSANEPHFDGDTEPTILEALVPSLKIFTTRPDTLFGVTYVVVAPEHPWIRALLPNTQNKKEVEEYIAKAKKQTDIVRTDAKREKTGVELKGISATNPANGEKVPVWVADYVLADYGTGAVMAVPAHDERDWDFAQKYGLPIKEVILPVEGTPHEGSEFRKTISSVVFRKSDNKFLALKWKKFGWLSVPIGGIENGESPETASEREVLEETGYKTKAAGLLGGKIESHFFAENKNVWRARLDQPVLLELIEGKASPVSEEEKEKHEVVWMTGKELLEKITHKYNGLGLERYLNGNYSYTGPGRVVNSGKFDGKMSGEVKKQITSAFGTPKTTYKLRDWVFSRQRYWGEPIPVVHCDECGIVPVPEKDLPVKLPEVENYKPTETGESPLAAISDWVHVKCPKCGSKKARRETDTMPNWAGSSWYYLRYTDPENAKMFASPEKMKYWTPVDWYNGGREHTTLHLLYSRFWHKFLFDRGLVPTPEPYKKRTSHGLILAKGGEKMSKSKGNVVNPDSIVEVMGADSLRLYEMFMGPFDQAISWDENGIVGCRRFIERVWKLAEKVRAGAPVNTDADAIVHRTVKKVSEDIETMRFNTAVSALMIAVNELEKIAEKSGGLSRENYAAVLSLLAPFAPHVTEELWQKLGVVRSSIHNAPWPIFDPAKIAEATARIAVQINGKTRSSFEISAEAAAGMDEKKAREMAVALDEIKKWIYGKEIKKVIYVKSRLINIVIA